MSFRPSSIAAQMLSVDEAQRLILGEVTVAGVEVIPLDEALGRTLREPVRATRNVPLTDNSGMDGYAVRTEDLVDANVQRPTVLRVTGDVAAGRRDQQRLERGCAIRIMTGATVPTGADAIVPVEWTDAGTVHVAIHSPPKAGANIRRCGEDMRTGELVLRDGSLLRAGEIGVLASLQRALVPVGRRPRVAIVPTGDEIVGLDEPVLPGQVVNSNAHALAALAREAGATPRIAPVAPDSFDGTVAAIEAELGADIVLTTGGVSVGAYDWVKPALEKLGAEPRFWRVAMKPGKPLVFSRIGTTLVFGLPGNPVSCVVSFLLFVGPAIRRMTGQTGDVFGPVVHARTTTGMRSVRDRREFQRVRVLARAGAIVAEPASAQGSGVASSLVGANGLAIIPEGTDSVDAGESVSVLLFAAILQDATG